MNQEEWDKYPTYGDDGKRKKRKKTILVLILIILLAILFALITYFAGAWRLLQRIFPNSKMNLNQASNLVTPGKLKGEDSGDINIILLGMRGLGEKYPKLTNGIMVINYDIKSQSINTISLPRDFWISTDKYGNRKISYICDTSEYDKRPENCFDTAKYVAKNALGIDIDYDFIVDFRGFVQIIDQTGSRVNVNVGQHYNNWLILQDPSFSSAKDVTSPSIFHLDSDQSLTFVRWPENALPDFDRLYRDQLFADAFKNQFLSSSVVLNPVKVQAILQNASNNVRSDMQVWEAVRLAEVLKNVSSNKISNHSLTSTVGTNGGLLKETNFDGVTLSPQKGDYDYSEIKSWAGAIIAK